MSEYKLFTKESTILSVLNEEENEDGSSVILTVRVLNDSKWKKTIKDILMSSSDAETFGVTVRQEYYLKENSPAFVWSILIWGDLEDAKEHLKPILSKRGGPPAPPKSLGITAPVSTRHTPRQRMSGDGSVVRTVPLPYKRRAPPNKEETITIKILVFKVWEWINFGLIL